MLLSLFACRKSYLLNGLQHAMARHYTACHILEFQFDQPPHLTLTHKLDNGVCACMDVCVCVCMCVCVCACVCV